MLSSAVPAELCRIHFAPEGSQVAASSPASSLPQEPISAELPSNVELRVEQTDPGFKGDTATGGTKPARTETGLVVNVPLFVNTGDVIRVSTRDGSYLELA